MRGIFTAGALDFLLDFGVRFDYIIGSSAGASNGLSYASGQRGRARVLNSDFLEKYSYIGLMRLIRTGCIMDYKLLFEDIPLRLYPFDFDAYLKNQPRYIMCATSCADGRARYFEKCPSYERTIAICRASCSMPFLCRIAEVDGECFLDGGIADSVPVEKSVSDGNRKNVVILTRNEGYRKLPEKVYIPPFFYARFPKLREALSLRNARYNASMEFIEKGEKNGEQRRNVKSQHKNGAAYASERKGSVDGKIGKIEDRIGDVNTEGDDCITKSHLQSVDRGSEKKHDKNPFRLYL